MPFSARVLACENGSQQIDSDGTAHAMSVVRLDCYLPMKPKGTGQVRAGDGTVRAIKTERVKPDFEGWVDEVRIIAVETTDRLPLLSVTTGTPIFLDV